MQEPSKSYIKLGDRIVILTDVKRGTISLKQASELLKISYRHAKRLYKIFKTSGVMGLLPKKRTKPPWNKTTTEIKQKIISIKQQFPTIPPMADCHLTDLLKEQGITISHETVRTILIHNQRHTPNLKLKRRPRKRFEAEKAGKLVQMDTSPYHWLPAIDKELKLILTFDDHSRKPLAARIAEHDTTWENICVLRKTVEKYGIFETFYTDCDAKFKYYRTNFSLYFNYQKPPEAVDTQISQALAELGIIILNTHPHAPHEKGKIERFFGFLQARLPIEFQRHGITTLAAANRYLEKYLDRYSSQWVHNTTGIIPDERFKNSCFKPLPADCDLDAIFCLRETRKVKKDNTFSYKGQTFQLTNFNYRAYWGDVEIALRIIPGKEIRVYHQDRLVQRFRYNGDR
ncbi:MAG: helix-turn-helix domain-containing protein [candidate division WOR-3 bacterium]